MGKDESGARLNMLLRVTERRTDGNWTNITFQNDQDEFQTVGPKAIFIVKIDP